LIGPTPQLIHLFVRHHYLLIASTIVGDLAHLPKAAIIRDGAQTAPVA
jgi:hypothetical protein